MEAELTQSDQNEQPFNESLLNEKVLAVYHQYDGDHTKPSHYLLGVQ